MRMPGTRPGFFLGDGAGVGKGRQIAGLIKEFWLCGGRRVWQQCPPAICTQLCFVVLNMLSLLNTEATLSLCALVPHVGRQQY